MTPITAAFPLIANTPHISTNKHIPLSGSMQYNSDTGGVEVFNGYSWVPCCPTHISLDSQVLEVIDWARKKMKEESALETLCNEHPALKKAKDRFELLKLLVSNEDL